MKSVKLGELANALDRVRQDGTAKSVTAVAVTASTSTFLSLDTPDALTGARDDPEEALKNLIDLLTTKGFITNSTTAT